MHAASSRRALSSAASLAAGQAGDDDVEQGDNAVDDSHTHGADGVDDGHQDISDRAEDGLDLEAC